MKIKGASLARSASTETTPSMTVLAAAPATESSSTGSRPVPVKFAKTGGLGLQFEGLTYVRVFQEDGCLRHDVTASKIHNAFMGFTGESMAAAAHDVRYDDGDGWTDVYRTLGVIVVTSYDGSALYVDEKRLPQAALFGSRWTFEDWKRVAEGFRSMRDPEPVHSTTRRLVALGDYASAIAAEFQNERPMTSAEIDETQRLLADFEKQIPNVVEELATLARAARNRLTQAVDAGRKRSS